MEAITRYFEAEHAEILLFIAVGLVALVLAGGFWLVLKKPFFNGMAVSLALVAAIQLTVGGMVFVRSPRDTARVQQMLQADRLRPQSEVVPRMQAVMKNFVIYRWTEAALLLLLGLLLLDHFAERRDSVYLAWLATAL